MTSRPKPLYAKARQLLDEKVKQARARAFLHPPVIWLTQTDLNERISREVAAQMARRVFVMRAK
jgi:RNA-binding protein YhbY